MGLSFTTGGLEEKLRENANENREKKNIYGDAD